MIPEFIVDRVMMSTLLTDRSLDRETFSVRFRSLKTLIREFLTETELNFISNNSSEFKEFLEERVGSVDFSKSFAVRKRKDSVRLFVDGIEIFDEDKTKTI